MNRNRGSENRISARITWPAVLLLALLALAVAAYSPLAPWAQSGITTDQAVFLTIARGITRGRLAYVDYFDHKGPLLYLLLAAGLKLGELLPGTLTGCWIIEIVVTFLSCILMYRIAAMYASTYIAILPAAVTMLLNVRFYTTSNSEEYIYPLLLWTLLLFMEQIRFEAAERKMFAMGFAGMAVFFIKYNYCLIWAALGILLVIHMAAGHMPVRRILKKCLLFLLGMAAATVFPLCYLLATGSFGAFMDAYVLYSVHYAEYASLAGRIDSIGFLIWTPMGWYLIGFLILCAVTLIAWLVAKRDELPGLGALNMKEWLYWLLVMAIVILATASPGQKWVYYRQATYAVYMVPIAIVSQMLYQFMTKRLPAVLSGLVICLLGVWTIRSGFQNGCWLPAEDSRWESTRYIASFISSNTDEDDVIISFSNDCSLYFYSGLEPASRILFPSAAIVDETLRDELMDDLSNVPAAYMTFQRDWENGLNDAMIEEVESFRDAHYSFVYDDGYRSVYELIEE